MCTTGHHWWHHRHSLNHSHQWLWCRSQVTRRPVPVSSIASIRDHWTGSTSSGKVYYNSIELRVLIYIYLSHRYQLDNGNTRYERAYWLPVGKDLVLAKKGYYSVPLPNDKYSTVFYTADHRGYHVDMREFHRPKVHSHSKPLMNLSKMQRHYP